MFHIGTLEIDASAPVPVYVFDDSTTYCRFSEGLIRSRTIYSIGATCALRHASISDSEMPDGALCASSSIGTRAIGVPPMPENTSEPSSAS